MYTVIGHKYHRVLISMHICEQVGELAQALTRQWKRLCMAYSPPREEPGRSQGEFLDDMSFSEEEMSEMVAVPPGGDSPTDSSDDFDFFI